MSSVLYFVVFSLKRFLLTVVEFLLQRVVGAASFCTMTTLPGRVYKHSIVVTCEVLCSLAKHALAVLWNLTRTKQVVPLHIKCTDHISPAIF